MGAPVIELPRAGMAGKYRICAVNAITGKERVLADWFDNLITDVGLDYVANNNNWKAWCHIGVGTLTPANSDTSLQSPVKSTSAISNNVSSVSGTPYYYTEYSCDYTFTTGAGTYTEVGVASGNYTGSYTLFSRALIVDGSGNPTSITTLANEYLVVTYRIRIYPPLTDVTGTIGIGSDTFSYILRASNVNVNNQWGWALFGGGLAFNETLNGKHLGIRCYTGGIAAITTEPGGNIYNGYTTTLYSADAYVNGSHQIAYNIRTDFTHANNVGYITCIRFLSEDTYNTFMSTQTYQIQFTPNVPKNSNIQLTWKIGIGWARA